MENDGLDGQHGQNDFELDSTSWVVCPRIAGMSGTSQEEDFFHQWSDVSVYSYVVGSETGITSSFELQLAPGYTLDPPHLLSLAQHLKYLSILKISAPYCNLRWSDWVRVLSFVTVQRS